MSRRRKNPSPSVVGTILFAAAAGTGLYLWSSAAKAEAKDKKKKLTSTKPPRVNEVRLLTALPDSQDLPKAPWLLLVYCDNDPGRAALAMFAELGKAVPDTVQLYALSSSSLSPEVADQLVCGTVTGDSGSITIMGAMFGQRVVGSWLETVDGGDQETLVLVGNPDIDDLRMQTALAWTQGAAELPLDSSDWVGDPEKIWVPWDTQPPVIHVQVGGLYTLPLPKLPATDLVLEVSSSDPVVEAFDSSPDLDAEVSTLVYIQASAPATAAIISIQQGDWKRQALIRAKA
jgi:hypothetical protein